MHIHELYESHIWKLHDLNSLFGQKNHGFRWGYNWQEY